MGNINIIGVGTPVSDHIAKVAAFPQTGESVRMIAESFQFGGKTASAVAAAARLGESCAMIGPVGGDPEGRANIADLKRHNVDTSHIIVDNMSPTGTSIVICDDATGSRTIFASNRNTRRPQPGDLDEAFIKGAKILLIDKPDDASKLAAKWMREAGGKVVYGGDRLLEGSAEMLAYIDVLIASDYYMTGMFGNGTDPLEAAGQLLAQGPEAVIITLGSKGCVGVSGEGAFALPAYRIEPVDTTGAGDVFHGAFAYARLRGMSVWESARFSSAASAIKCLAIGGRAGMPTAAMVERFMHDGFVDMGILRRREEFYRNKGDLSEEFAD